MGLIKAALGAAGGVLADQWKEYFYCEAIDKEILVVKGQKRQGGRSSNTKGSDNVISNGSVIAIADGQAMAIVENGKVVEFSAEPGEFTYDTSIEPSIFTGSLKTSIVETFKQVGKRFTYGGDTGKDQRVYYFNTKEIIDNKFGTANPIGFRFVDEFTGYRASLHVRCSGVYSYKIVDPLLFYTNVCGNVSSEYTRSEIDNQLKTEFIAALQPAMAGMSKYNLLPEDLLTHNTEIEDELRSALSKSWSENRGIEVCKVSFGSVSVPDEDQKKINDAQDARYYSNAGNAAGLLARSTAESQVAAANNSAGAMTGFMGMGMAMNQNSANLGGLFQQASQQPAYQSPFQPAAPTAPAGDTWTCACGNTATGKFCQNCGAKKPEPVAADSWTCACGNTATGKFCTNCGSKKPEPATDNGWTCACGKFNQGRFCPECGAKKPEGVPTYKCDKCGWVPEDPAHPPKFCPECGDIFDDSDKN